jgi:spore coat polysaccharide biosynthesis predicted glycosyltransferase SpsG
VTRRILLRCDADERTGLGHAARALALGEALTARLGAEPEFVSRPTALLLRFAGERRVPVTAVTDVGYDSAAVLAAASRAVALVSDTYELDAGSLARVCAARLPHVVVDDFARLADWPCDVVVNPNLGADPDRYRGAGRVLAGAAYALVRREVREAAAVRRPTTADCRVLVCLGGGAWPAAAGPLLAALVSAGLGVRATTREPVPAGVEAVDPDSLPAQFVWADVAVISGGVVKYEAAACGVPTVVTAVVEHQHDVAAAFASTGAAVYAGEIGRAAPAALCDKVTGLLADERRRAAMAAAGRALVDGRGAERAADALLEQLAG